MPIYKTGKSKDGKAQYKVVVNYTDNNGVYRQMARRVYGSAEAKMEELSLLRELGEVSNPSKMTVTQLCEDCRTAKKKDVRQSSAEKTQSILNNHVIPHIGNERLEKLTTERLQKWKNEIAEKPIKVSTKNNAYKEFNAVLNYAVKVGYIKENNLKKLGGFKDPYLTKKQKPLRYYTPEQFRNYISVAEKYKDNSFLDHAYYVFFNIAYYTGMRKGEINALKWSDIQGNLINITRSISQKTKGVEMETAPKNESSFRTLQMPQKLVLILEQHRTLQKQIKGFSSGFRVCGGVSTLKDTSVENKNKKFCGEAELPHIRIHDFRHSHASLLANNGINIQEIARRLGHSNVQQTWSTYSHLYPREEERAVSVLDSV